ncbi:MAG: hypothetical protein WBG02_16530 [Candidatus Acidiferrum sp.]
MLKRITGIIALVIFAQLVLCFATPPAKAQTAKTPYPSMAPLDQYLMADQDSEVALARTAAPKSISDGAEVMVLGREGYKTASKGGNGFVCMVERSWTAGIDDPDFWNPKIRSPLCLNAAAARTYLPITLMKTKLVLAGKSKTEMFQQIASALDKKELPSLEQGAMCYMLSREQYLSDEDKSWHPHLMFFVPLTTPETWGANLPGSPILAGPDPQDRLIIFLVPVRRWSDGTLDQPNQK